MAAPCAARPSRKIPCWTWSTGWSTAANAGKRGGLSLPLTASGLAALRYVLYGDPRRLYSFSLPPEGLRALNHAADAYVSAQLERSFRTLDYYKTILPQEETKYE